MIACLRGVLIQSNHESIVVEVSGIGYEVHIHSRAVSLLPSLGSQLFINIYLQVLDNDLKLFGFLSQEELELFKTLLAVSGIGARGALNILSAMEPRDFYQSIVSGDEKSLLNLPGIGKKTAQRLIFELKDKVGKQPGLVLNSQEGTSNLEEILEAMEVLGYQRSEIFPLLMDMKTQGDLSERIEDNIKKVLRYKAMQMKK